MRLIRFKSANRDQRSRTALHSLQFDLKKCEQNIFKLKIIRYAALDELSTVFNRLWFLETLKDTTFVAHPIVIEISNGCNF